MGCVVPTVAWLEGVPIVPGFDGPGWACAEITKIAGDLAGRCTAVRRGGEHGASQGTVATCLAAPVTNQVPAMLSRLSVRNNPR